METRPSRILSAPDASTELLRAAGTKLKTIAGAASWMKAVVNKVLALHHDERRAAVTRIVHARFLACAIMLREFDMETERHLMGVWERVTFRIFTLAGRDARSKIGDYVQLGYDVRAKQLDAIAIAEALVEIGKGYSIEEVITEHTWKDWYEGRSEAVRYLLHRYEEHLAREASMAINESQWVKVWAADPARSIEHIAPQSSGERYVHHLGNLTMLPPGVNSSLKDKPPHEKAAKYVECGLQATMQVGREIQDGLKWGEQAVLDRMVRIEAFARKEWAD